MSATDKERDHMQRALIALDACEALRIKLPGKRRPVLDRDKRIVWGTLLQVANPHVTLPPSPKHAEA